MKKSVLFEILIIILFTFFAAMIVPNTSFFNKPEYIEIDKNRPDYIKESVIPIESASKININTANEMELSTLPGIGKVLSERIVKYREEHGYFNSVYELVYVKGITSKFVEKNINNITTGP